MLILITFLAERPAIATWDAWKGINLLQGFCLVVMLTAFAVLINEFPTFLSERAQWKTENKEYHRLVRPFVIIATFILCEVIPFWYISGRWDVPPLRETKDVLKSITLDEIKSTLTPPAIVIKEICVIIKDIVVLIGHGVAITWNAIF